MLNFVEEIIMMMELMVPYILIFDLGENPRQYDSFGFMPRLQWTQQAPKTVQIEVSDDLKCWLG